MYDQEKYEPLKHPSFLMMDNPIGSKYPETVARGQLRLNSHYYEGKVDGEA